jgi:hypothetical protein
MRPIILISAFVAVFAAGCASRQELEPGPEFVESGNAFAANESKLIVTPSEALLGRVARSNPMARFVVIEFPLGQMPAVGSRFGIYRQGQKVGEVRISGPQQDVYVVGDLTDGEAQINDDVRDQ